MASWSYHAVVVAGALGCVLVLVAALVVVPAFVRLVRRRRLGHGAPPRVPRPRVPAPWRLVLLGAAVVWAHHLSSHDRNGGLPLYGALFVVTGLAVVLGTRLPPLPLRPPWRAAST